MSAILVPLDGSDLARRALPFATTLAQRTGRQLILLRAVTTLPTVSEAGVAAIRREAADELEADASTVRAEGQAVETLVVDGEPDSVILDAVVERGVGLLVMSTQGRGGLGRWIYGSVADSVLRRSPVPVLLVPPAGLPAWSTDRQLTILVPLDGSPLAESVLDPACALADTLDAGLFLVQIVSFAQFAMYAEAHAFADASFAESELNLAGEYLEAVAARLRTERRPVDVKAAYGSPFLDVATVAHEVGAQVIAMATQGRGGVKRALLGSVATSTVRRTDVPLLLIRPHELDEVVASEDVPSSAAASAPATEVSLAVSPEELDILVRSVGERLHDQPVDPRQAGPARRLLEKLRAAQGV